MHKIFVNSPAITNIVYHCDVVEGQLKSTYVFNKDCIEDGTNDCASIQLEVLKFITNACSYDFKMSADYLLNKYKHIDPNLTYRDFILK